MCSNQRLRARPLAVSPLTLNIRQEDGDECGDRDDEEDDRSVHELRDADEEPLHPPRQMSMPVPPCRLYGGLLHRQHARRRLLLVGGLQRRASRRGRGRAGRRPRRSRWRGGGGEVRDTAPAGGRGEHDAVEMPARHCTARGSLEVTTAGRSDGRKRLRDRAAGNSGRNWRTKRQARRSPGRRRIRQTPSQCCTPVCLVRCFGRARWAGNHRDFWKTMQRT